MNPIKRLAYEHINNTFQSKAERYHEYRSANLRLITLLLIIKIAQRYE